MPGLARNFSIFSASMVFLNLSGTLISSSSSGAVGTSGFSIISPIVGLRGLFFHGLNAGLPGLTGGFGACLAFAFGAGLASGLRAGFALALGAALTSGFRAGFALALGAALTSGFRAGFAGLASSFAGFAFLGGLALAFAGFSAFFAGFFFGVAGFLSDFKSFAVVSSSRLDEWLFPFMPIFSSAEIRSLLGRPSSFASSYILLLAISAYILSSSGLYAVILKWYHKKHF
jgi:hypothetical protein